MPLPHEANDTFDDIVLAKPGDRQKDKKFLAEINVKKRHIEDEAIDDTRRSLAATELNIAYTITIAVNDNAGVGDVEAIKVRTAYCKILNA